ncbi:hypothetical protein [Pseudoduganella guangdongensis]|nr:hypothetical protein [Pseudoduganella guangdongensis]
MSELKDLTTYSKDTPIGLPSVGGRAGVFVPTAEFDVSTSTTIRHGAGIVGFGNPDGTLTIYYEANRFDDSSLHKWENKARKAYDRMVMVAPTVSKAKLNAKYLEFVGYIDGSGITLKEPERVTEWLTQSNAQDTAPAGPVVLWGKK